MKNRRNLIIVAVLIILLGFLFFRNQSKKTKPIETATVKRGTLKETLTLSGAIDANERVILRFQTGGRLAWVGVKKGDIIKKYQVIATLDPASVKKALQKELNDFAKSRRDLDQSRDDNKDKVITDTIKRTLEKYQYDVNNAILDVELQDLVLQYSRLVSPIEGIVTAVSTPYAGVNVTVANAEFEIVNPKTIFFVVSADQTEVIKLKEGMKGTLVLDSYDEEEIKGEISQIAFTPTTGETGTVYAIKFTVPADNSNLRFRLGMTGDISFILKEKKNTLYLPTRFIAEENGKNFVSVMKKGKKSRQSVITGLETEDSIEIVSGVSEGDIIYD